MRSRLRNSILFAGIFAIGFSSAQEGTSEVPVPRNVYGAIIACGADGQAYFSSIGDEYFVLRTSLDGSSLKFRLPKVAHYAYAGAVATHAGGVNVLSSWTDRTKFMRTMYHFDEQGNLLAQHSVRVDLTDMMMVITRSGTTILVGHRDEDGQYKGLILDSEDRIVNGFDLPSPPDEGEWTYGEWHSPSDRLLMTTGDRVAYVLLHSNEPPRTMIATISESGKVSVKTLEPISEDHRYIQWLVGPGVAVGQYRLTGDRRRVNGHHVWNFDEYDLKSGNRIASKIAPMGEFTPFTAACYYGDSVTGLGARQVAPDEPYLRLRIVKLQ